jgi:hypothetical protein
MASGELAVMSIVATEFDVKGGGGKWSVYFRCQDHLGQWHPYGPIVTSNEFFDPNDAVSVVEGKVAARLAEQEFSRVIG